jgi:hypothetical protein
MDDDDEEEEEEEEEEEGDGESLRPHPGQQNPLARLVRGRFISI